MKSILLILLLCDYVSVCGGAIDVRVGILPSPTIQLGHSATLICEYELHGATLYSVKWYKGHREFYRVVPNEKIEAQKIFPFPGLNIDVSLYLLILYTFETLCINEIIYIP